MPITAFLPAFIALFGMDETDEGRVPLVRHVLLPAGGGGGRSQPRGSDACSRRPIRWARSSGSVLWLMFRASFPAIFGSFRILYDIGWTYVILAEMVNARKASATWWRRRAKSGFRARLCRHHRHRRRGVPVPLPADVPGALVCSPGAGRRGAARAHASGRAECHSAPKAASHGK